MTVIPRFRAMRPVRIDCGVHREVVVADVCEMALLSTAANLTAVVRTDRDIIDGSLGEPALITQTLSICPLALAVAEF
jgi:hypothetical protein